MIEECVGWYEWFTQKARLEFADDFVDVVRHPRVEVRQADWMQSRQLIDRCAQTVRSKLGEVGTAQERSQHGQIDV